MKKVYAMVAICSLLLLAVPVYAQVSASSPCPSPCPGPTAGAPRVTAPGSAYVCPGPKPAEEEVPQRAAEPKLGPYIGIGASYALENFDDVDIGGISMNPNLDDTWGFNARIGYQSTPMWAFELEYVYIPFEDTIIELDVQTLMAVAKLSPSVQFPVKPFLALGLGWMDGSADVTGGAGTTSVDDSDFAGKIGIGVDWYPVPAFSIGVEADYVSGFGDVDEIAYTNLMLGVAYHW